MKRTKTLSAMSFAAYDVERRTRKGSFYAQVDTIIDWNPISAIIDQHYQKGLSASGEKPYDGDSCCSKCYSSGCGTQCPICLQNGYL
ncbi:hypothetical protein [Capnocytophaga canimorsus]|uniref:hypothetical protein n=1 Tax=Capnocytophaga canimorsus TaxID=28188 RepID=UPI0020FFFF42|nr:hypothetical protein [Capnocytophaga canimorsus]